MAQTRTLNQRIDDGSPGLDALPALLTALYDRDADTILRLAEYKTLVDEQHDDHAVFKDIIEELMADHATFKTVVEEMTADHATFKTAAANQKTWGGALCLTKAQLMIGTAATLVKVGAASVMYAIAGQAYDVASAEIAFTATTHDIATSTSIREAVFAVSVSTNSTFTLTMGTIATGTGNAVIPDVPAGECPVGHVRIATPAGAPITLFDATTTALDTAGLVVTYTDMMQFPQMIGDGPATLGTAAPATLSESTPATLAASKPTAITASAPTDPDS